MASMLAYEPRELEAWEYILKSLGTKFVPNTTYEDMIYILDLSYKNLPPHLKACFLYLGSYPEDYEINRDELVRRWVAEGFVSNSDGKHDAWVVAESYFNELVNRSMVQPTYMKIHEYFFTDVVSGCRVHDMVLELIVRRCKEDNFLSLVNNVEARVEAQDRVIRRLTVASMRDAGDSKVDTSIFVRAIISQVRSLAILGESNWIPPLKFKYIRVFILKNPFGRDWAIKDLTCINQLGMLRYLEVEANIVALPAQIRGLPYLETLNLSRVYSTSPTEIIDVPRLSHLLMPDYKSMWYMTGKMKSLRTLHGFRVPLDSSESTAGLGELTGLSDLEFYFPERCVLPENKTKCMASLSNSLEKLYNLKRLYVCNMMKGPGGALIACCADELNSLSPAFRKLEHLRITGCRFSRAPKWIGLLQKLRVLQLGAKQIFQEDIAIIGRGSSSLTKLSLQITSIPTERIVIGGSTGFPLLKLFEFDCDGISYMSFEAGAMPELRELKLVLDVNEWDKATPGGLQHLPSLKKIISGMSFYGTAEWQRRYHAISYEDRKAEEKLIKSVFQKAADALPTSPTFIFEMACVIRRVEEAECSNVVD